jgi:spore coat protein A
LPANSVITGVTLKMSMSAAPPSGTGADNVDVSLHLLSRDWGEGASDPSSNEGTGTAAVITDSTWTDAFWDATTPTAWTTAGGDFSGTDSAVATVGRALQDYSWTSAAMVTEVQDWFDTPSSNHGWLVDVDISGNGDARRFDSRESPTSAARPRLVIDFDTVVPVGACCAADGSCATTEAASCADLYEGDNTVCSPNPCPQPPAVCCIPDETAACSVVTEDDCSDAGGVFDPDLSSCAPNPCPVVLTPFIDALPIPKVATPTSGVAGGAASYRISEVEATQQLHHDLPPTRLWMYDDGTGPSYPGPTIEAASDQPVTVTWVNDLRDELGDPRTHHLLAVDPCAHGAEEDTPRTVVHLHGAHVEAASDGNPEDTRLPGQQSVYHYANQQSAATLWYHDHALGITRLNVYLGLAAFYLLHDATEQALDLPSGEFEIPLVIQDRTFAPDGSLVYDGMLGDHFAGQTILVNGKVWPYLDVKQGKYRFRILNGSGTRTYRMTLSDGSPWTVIGSDGGLLEAPVTQTELQLAPAERADVVVDFSGYSAGAEIVVQNDAPVPFPGTPGDMVIPDVMKFVVEAAPGDTDPLPTSLRTITPIDENDAVMTRDFILRRMAMGGMGGCEDMWMINDLMWDDITEFPQLGTTEIWRFINPSGMMHPMHMHLVMFQVLDRQPMTLDVDDKPVATDDPVPPEPWEAGWKDTVEVPPGMMVRVIARFTDYTGLYAYHCHILEHEDHEMMRQFHTVTTCGDGALGMPDEECDDAGESAECDVDCTMPVCGDGVTNTLAGETCDDGGTVDGDGCSSTCTLEADDGGEVDGGGPDGGETDGGPGDVDLGDAGGDSNLSAGDTDAPSGNATSAGCGCGAAAPGDVVPWLSLAMWALTRRRRARESRPPST